MRVGPNEPPLCEITLLNRPLANGDAASILTEIPPADSPAIVTLLASPPKWLILFLSHFKAAI